MVLASTTLLALKALASWIVLQWLFDAVVERAPSVKPVIKFMRTVNSFAVTAGMTFCALLVLLPSFAFVVLEVFGHVQLRTQSLPSKTFSDYVQRAIRILNELEALGERMRHAAAQLSLENQEALPNESVVSPDMEMLPETCGNVLLAVCKHSESLEQLFVALSPPEVDELVYCNCEDFEVRGEKIVSLIGRLRECMERQTEVVQAVDALVPMIPAAPGADDQDCVDDSGFIDC